MNPIEVCNGGYANDSLWFMKPDGEVIYKNIEELEYPYFYADIDMKDEEGVVRTSEQEITILYPDTNVTRKMWKIEVYQPFFIAKLRWKAGLTSEDDIRYIERRLGADNIIEWVSPQRFVSMDIETNDRDDISLIGAQIIENNVKGEVLFFTSADDYVRFLQTEAIASDGAWNGHKFDFPHIEDELKNKQLKQFYSKLLHLDTMKIYCKLKQKRFLPLNQAGVAEDLGTKMDISTETLMRGNPEEIKEYNARDVDLQSDIMIKLKAVSGYIGLSNKTGVHPNYLSQIPMVENYIMKHRDRFGLWLARQEKHPQENIEGAAIKFAVTGMYKGVGVVDYSSLYPTGVIVSEYNGQNRNIWNFFKRLMKEFMDFKTFYRKQFKETHDEVDKMLGEVYKIFANGSYGVFGNPYFRYSDGDIANFITKIGREQFYKLNQIVIDLGYKIIYGDTDSVFIEAPEELIEGIVATINEKIAPFEVKLDYYFKRVSFIGSREEIKKRYAGLKNDGKIEIKGLETVRKDYNYYVRRTQKEAINVMLHSPEEQVIDNVKLLINDRYKRLRLKKIELGDLLITKTVDLSKKYKVDAPHVVAYKRLADEKQFEEALVPFVSYWVGKNGVIPLGVSTMEEELKTLDWDYYINNFQGVMNRFLLSIDGIIDGLEMARAGQTNFGDFSE